jgi:hypothetical protein
LWSIWLFIKHWKTIMSGVLSVVSNMTSTRLNFHLCRKTNHVSDNWACTNIFKLDYSSYRKDDLILDDWSKISGVVIWYLG